MFDCFEAEHKCEICGYIIPRYTQVHAESENCSGVAEPDALRGNSIPDRLCTGCRRAIKAAREQRGKETQRK